MKKEGFFSRNTKGASIWKTDNGYRLTIPASKDDVKSQFQGYRLAQLDDYTGLTRRKFPHHSLTLSLRARASSASIPGTWGFGLWNDPFGLSPGFGGNPFRLPALPNAAWFFHASPSNYLSFHDDKPGQGFLAQTFRAPAFHPLIIPAGLAFPFSRKVARRLLSRMIDEDGVRLEVDVTQWHGYRFEWSQKRVLFEVDNARVLETSVSPPSPLGLVIWIDNQYAEWTPDGKLGFGVLQGGEEWIEVEDIVIHNA
jgi:hypothetical protein